MLEGYLYNHEGCCLLLGEDEIFNETTEKREFTKFRACEYGDNLPVDGSCYKCKVYKRLSIGEVENILGKKPNDL